MKQTAVEFLVKKINELTGLTITIDEPCIEEADKMFEQQIIDAHLNGQAEFDTDAFRDKVTKIAKQYYNETYNK